MKARLRIKPIHSVILAAALCFGPVAYAQNAASNTANKNTAKNNTATSGSEDEYPDLIEIDPFGGIATYGSVQRGLTTKLVDGGVGGIRVGFNPAKYFGIEAWADYAWGNVEFKRSSGNYPGTTTPLPNYAFGNRIWYFGLNPVINLKPRGSKVVPYLTAGVTGIDFKPTWAARDFARFPNSQAQYMSGNLGSNLQVGLNYGGGVKVHLTPHVGLRFDARGFWSRNPTFDLPNYPNGGIYIPDHDKLNSFQGTVGLIFFAGTAKCPPMPPAPAPPPPLPTPTITGAENITACQGKPVTLHANIAAPAGRKLAYSWKLNGNTEGSDSPDFTFTPNNQGTFNVEVTVRDVTPPPPAPVKPRHFPKRCWVQPSPPPPAAPVTATASITVNSAPPTISSVTATPASLVAPVDQGPHTSQLSTTATAGPCGGNLTYKWTVSEGSLSNDTSATPTFDASTLNFQGPTAQTKTVTATVTVTDQTGKTASQSTTITVNYTPPFVRLDDIVFPKNRARVNNCGKDILIDQAAPRATSGDYDVVLVGHRATDERANVTAYETVTRGRRHVRHRVRRPLDEQRVLNAAAVLSGGTATCGKVDPANIKVVWVGTQQSSEPRPGLCGTSNLPPTKERRGAKVSEADRDRRVEVYLVPKNVQTLPPAAQSAQPVNEDEVRALGCPK
ncbi:MAG TPA: PKD domain-containing protein [Bryobacteraceae bacterium]